MKAFTALEIRPLWHCAAAGCKRSGYGAVIQVAKGADLPRHPMRDSIPAGWLVREDGEAYCPMHRAESKG